MKLYTEEQVKNLLEKMSLETERKNLAVSANWRHRVVVIDTLLKSLTPIELPSDEELRHLSPGYKSETDYDIGFLHGWNTGVKVYYDRILNKTI